MSTSEVVEKMFTKARSGHKFFGWQNMNGVCIMTKSDLIRVAFFEGQRIRKIMNEGEWWVSVIDIVDVLTASNTPKRYWSDLKRKLAKEGYSELCDKIVQLKFVAADGKYYATDCAAWQPA